MGSVLFWSSTPRPPLWCRCKRAEKPPRVVWGEGVRILASRSESGWLLESDILAFWSSSILGFTPSLKPQSGRAPESSACSKGRVLIRLITFLAAVVSGTLFQGFCSCFLDTTVQVVQVGLLSPLRAPHHSKQKAQPEYRPSNKGHLSWHPEAKGQAPEGGESPVQVVQRHKSKS